MIITEISVQKKNKKRCNIYVDGSFSCALDSFTVLKYNLKVGQEITTERLEELSFESEKDKALSYAFDYISKYFKTEKQLKDKLYEKGYMRPVVDYVMEKVKEYGYVNDERYVKAYIESNGKKKGTKLLKYELKGKGVSDEILNEIKRDERSEKAACKAFAEKFFSKNEMTKENVRKLYQRLYARGFSYDIVSETLDSIRSEVEDDGEY